MPAGRQRPERRPPHDPFVLVAKAQQVSEVRMAAVKLLHLERLVGPCDLMLLQIGDEPRPIELLFFAHLAEFR